MAKGLPLYIYMATVVVYCIRVKAFGQALIALGLQGHWEEVDSVV